jgi:cytochrome P450 family 6
METYGSLLLQAGALATIILAVIYIYIKSSYSYWTKLGIPTYNPVVPFGNFSEAFVKNTGFQALLTEFYKAFEGHKLGGLYGLTSRFLLVRDPDLIRDILVKDFDRFHDRGVNVVENADPLQQHLFALSGTKWRNLRVKLTPTFTSGKMKMMFGTLVDCGQQLKTVLREPARKGESFEVKDVLARFATDVIASCAFGIQCNCLQNPDAEFRQWGRRIFSPTFKTRIFRLANLLMPSLIKLFGITFIPKDVSNYFMEMVRETIEFREKNGLHRNDFMQLLIQLKNKTLTTADQDDSVYDGMEYKLDVVDDKTFSKYYRADIKLSPDLSSCEWSEFWDSQYNYEKCTI